MKAGIKVFRTDEIDDLTWMQICKGYEMCFDTPRDPEQLKKFFSNSISGYTLHALKLNEKGMLMGHNYFQPRPYKLYGKDVICALSGGTFVMPEYRKDIFIFKDLFDALCEEAKRLGWIAQIGVPNENSFKYCVKIIKDKYIGDLNYYILPVHIGKILKRKNNLLDTISAGYAFITSKLNLCLSTIANLKEKKVPLHIDESDKFLSIRLANPDYRHIRKGNMRATYRMYDEDGINTAYILQFGENGKRSVRSLAKTVNAIMKNEKPDAILYVGSMNLKQMILTRVPKSFVPHRLTVTVSVFEKDNKELEQTLSSLSNFDYGLLNFDVR